MKDNKTRAILRFIVRVLVIWAIQVVGLVVMAILLPGVNIDTLGTAIVAAAVMGWGPMEVGTNFIAAERGLGPRSLDEVEVVGVPIDEVIYPFKRPQTHSDGQMFIDIRMPIEWYEERCTGCGICAEVCPGQAITMLERPVIDDGRCIQCFCCMELCPSGALRAIRPDE